jgi:hypothetical protein
MRILPPLALFAAALATSIWGGCSSGGDDAESGGQDQTAASAFSACTVISQKDGHTMTATELAKLGDPIANLILKGTDCPLTLTKIQAKLAANDHCDPGGDGGPNDNGPEPGLTSRFVTDRSQLIDKPDSYRAVLTRACQKREDNELLISVFGIQAQTDQTGAFQDVSVPDNTIELIGEAKTPPDANGVSSGVFNYYARENNQWKFFGSSADFVSSGYDCNADGACIPKAASKQRCAACHVGGGLNMKELESPWVNWEGGPNTFSAKNHPDRQGTFGTPGTAEMVKKRPDIFGTLSDGIAMEATVEQGNREWVISRIATLKTQGLKEVLRPLFCTTDMNLVEAGLNNTPDQNSTDPLSAQNQLLGDLLVDRAFNAFLSEGGTLTLGEYNAAIAANGQHIVTSGGQGLTGPDGKPLLDTVQGLTIPTRSGQDTAYITELQKERVIDIDIVKDVLSIDLSRPIYSATRCNLLNAVDFRPELAAGDMTFEKVKQKMVDAFGRVQNPSPAVTQLLASLKDPSDAGKHDFAAQSFMKACDARSKSDRAGWIKDYLTYASHLRQAVKRARNPVNGGIIEFPETLPVDGLQETRAAFDPTTCKLQ